MAERIQSNFCAGKRSLKRKTVSTNYKKLKKTVLSCVNSWFSNSWFVKLYIRSISCSNHMRLSTTIPTDCRTETTAAVVNVGNTATNECTSGRYIWFFTDTALWYTKCDWNRTAITWATNLRQTSTFGGGGQRSFPQQPKKTISMTGTQHNNKHRCCY